MTGWSVHIATHGGRKPTATAFEQFIDLMLKHHAAVTGSQNHTGYGAQFSVDADDAQAAVTRGLKIFRTAVTASNMPAATIERVEALTDDELDRELEQPAFPDLIGVAELAELLGVTRQRASEIQTRAGFPAPVVKLKSGPVWKRTSINAFLETWSRKPGRPATVKSGVRSAASSVHRDQAIAAIKAKTKARATP